MNDTVISVNLTNAFIHSIGEVIDKYNSSFDIDNYQFYELRDYVRELLEEDNPHYLYVENAGHGDTGELYVNLLFATDTGNFSSIVELIGMRTLLIRSVLKPDGLLLLGCYDLHRNAGAKNNRRKLLKLEFEFDSYGAPTLFHPALISEISALPDARLQSRIVQQRIRNWDIFLQLLETKAKEQNVLLKYDGYRISDTKRFLHLTIKGSIEGVKGKSLKHATARIGKMAEYQDEDERVDSLETIGMLQNVSNSTHEARIELSDEQQELIMLNQFWIPQQGMLHLSKMGDLVQTRRLRSGLKKLVRGKAKNPNIENILFDDDILLNNQGNYYRFNPDDMLRNDLNRYQQEAVRKALAAQDVFLIQGPPGTGKTTVIAELCYQNAIRGLRTLIASQSNLAVDNALSKLVHHPKIRALRKGNASRVEEEGKPFTEELVIDTWMDSTAKACRSEVDHLTSNYERIKNKKHEMEQQSNQLKQSYENSQEEKKQLESQIIQLEQQMAEITKRISQKKVEYQELTALHKKQQKQQRDVDSLLEKLSLQQETAFDDVYSLQSELDRQMQIQKETESYLEKLKADIQAEEETALQRKAAKEELDKLRKQANDIELSLNRLKLKIGKPTRQVETLRLLLHRSREVQNTEQQFKLVMEIVQTVPSVDQSISERLSFLKKTITESHANTTGSQYYQSLLSSIQGLQQTANEELTKLSIQVGKMVGEEKSAYEPTLLTVNRFRDELSGLLLNRPSAFLKLFGAEKKWRTELFNLSVEIYRTANTLKDLIAKQTVIEAESDINRKEFSRYLQQIYPGLVSQLRDQFEELSSETRDLNKEFAQKVKERNKIESLLASHERDLNKYRGKSLEELQREHDERQKQRDKCLKTIQWLTGQITEQTDKAQRQKEQARMEYEAQEKEFDRIQSEMDEQEKQIQKVMSSIERLQIEKSDLQDSLTQLKQMFAGYPKRKMVLESQLDQLEVRQKELLQERQVLETKEGILQEWVTRLEQKTERDKSGLKQIYIDSANVIGITCVQSGSREFSEEYPDFDVVIVDEVSKATPPEILLPILKGKKVILVGDHNQLPPMVGDDTLNEVVENGDYTDEEKDEMKEYLKESLFERLFNVFDDKYKETLRIQYRMHPHIMNTINQFYKNHDGIGLICGLKAPDKERNHGIEGKLIRSGRHILWLDMPLHPSHLEKQAEGGTSFYNETEIQTIVGALTEINESMNERKNQGLMDQDALKEVGIISFYGEQVKRLNQLILGDKENYKHLSIRIGTVDRFQGMERDIILASFVRNNPRGDIGFAKEYKRINVAMSRAKELLIVTGCSELFCNKAQKRYPAAAAMYKNIVNEIDKVDGHVDLLGRSLVIK